jgi:hypothetical protein
LQVGWQRSMSQAGVDLSYCVGTFAHTTSHIIAGHTTARDITSKATGSIVTMDTPNLHVLVTYINYSKN